MLVKGVNMKSLELVEKMLQRAEAGKKARAGYVAVPTWYSWKGYRDKIEQTDNGYTYLLWDYAILDKSKNEIVFYSWDSNLTRDRLNALTYCFDLPLGFTMQGGELYCNNWRFRKIVADTRKKVIKIYIDNFAEDIEILRY